MTAPLLLGMRKGQAKRACERPPTEVRGLTHVCAPPGTRTPDPLIKSQLL